MTRLPAIALLLLLTGGLLAEPLKQEPNTWVKRSPLKDGPPSPALAYEAALAYDTLHKVVIRWGGHNQGGGGEQNAETWTFDPVTAKWTIKEPNTSPPGVCCAQQNVFDPIQNRYVRFRSFSGSHGWHWFRENYLSNNEVWNYDLATNTWRDMRPVPAPKTSPLRCASWDSDDQVVVLFGGEGNQEGTVVYDPYANTWTRMNPKEQPAFRSGGNMAYDAARKLHILFGSQFSDDKHTWAYDLKKNEWKDLKPATMPPTDRNDPVLVYDPHNQAVIAVVQVVDRSDGKEVSNAHHETWAFDAGKNTWTKLNPAKEPDGWGNRRRLMVFAPDQNLAILEMYVNPTLRVSGVEREQQVWTYRYAEPKADPRPQPPKTVSLTTGDNSVTLSWDSVPGVENFAVYRGEGAHPWQVEWKKLTQTNKATGIKDLDLKRGVIYHYFVRSLDKNGVESADSIKVRSQPRVVEDAVASVLGPKEVRLSWKSPIAPATDIAAFQVERAVVEVWSDDQIQRLKKDTQPLELPSVGAIKAIGPFVKLDKTATTSFTDKSIDLTKPLTANEAIWKGGFTGNQLDEKGKPYPFAVYAYRIRAINQLGVESGPSPYILTIPSSPKFVFSKEAGEDCQLKWQASPETGIKGYRVYRMESPRINGAGQPVTRVTKEPIQETTYTDAKIGKATRRYWIVAVDALGQEGTPSAPTWHYREWQRFYTPFVGEWHQ